MDPKSDLIMGEIDETRTALTKKLINLEDQLRDTVENAKETVGDTIASFRLTIRKFSPSHQVQQRPFIMVGGSLAAGLLIGRRRRTRGASTLPRETQSPAWSSAAPQEVGAQSSPSSRSNLERQYEVRSPASSKLLTTLTDTFSEEIKMAKGIAFGIAIDAVRSLAARALPDFRNEIDKVMDSAKHSVGADPRIRHFETAETEIEKSTERRTRSHL